MNLRFHLFTQAFLVWLLYNDLVVVEEDFFQLLNNGFITFKENKKAYVLCY